MSTAPTILKYGLVAGTIVGSALLAVSLAYDGQPPPDWGMAAGFASMLIALSAVFVAIKRQRDVEGGGVIRFWPAFGLGLGISLVASLVYVMAWELSLGLIDTDAVVRRRHAFMSSYVMAWDRVTTRKAGRHVLAQLFARQMVARAEARGLTGEALAEAVRKASAFEATYRNPLYRLPMTFAEIFPVGVLVSLVSAAVLRNPRVLPTRA